MRRFHSYGPVDPRLHYCVPRTELVERCVAELVGEPEGGGHYFTIWAPRQTGKTWLMRRAMDEIRARHGERFIVATVSMQGVSLQEEDPPQALLKHLPGRIEGRFDVAIPPLPDWEALGDLFLRGKGPFDRPLILLIDEFDSLPRRFIDELVRVFRDTYLRRESSMLRGLALIGVRAVLGADSPRGSPFNVQRSLHVGNLTHDEVRDMFRQYEEESGQTVQPVVVDTLYEMMLGQPGLVGWFGELLAEKFVCRFSSPFVQQRLFNDLSADLVKAPTNILPLDPLDELDDVFAATGLDVPALLARYVAYLGRLSGRGEDPWKEQPRRADLRHTEAVGHFHLYNWLVSAVGDRCLVSPEFPTGNGTVDLVLRWKGHAGVIEVKSFTSRSKLGAGQRQAAAYAARLGLGSATVAVFVPVRDEAVLTKLSETKTLEGITVHTVAIPWDV